MVQSLKNIALGTLVSLAAVAYGNKTWHPNPAKDMGGSVSYGNTALVDMSWWVDESNNPGSGAPTAEDDLVFDTTSTGAKNRIRFNGGTVGTFTGNSLQIGTDTQGSTVVYDGTPLYCDNEGLKFKNGDWWFNSNRALALYCDVTILAEDASKPFVMHYGQAQYSNQVGSVRKKLKGSAAAQLVLGHWPTKRGDNIPGCAPNTTFELWDISEYAGTIVVRSAYENVLAADMTHGYGTHLLLDPCTSSAKLRIERGGSLSLRRMGDTVTVKELSLAAGSRLWFNQNGERTTDDPLWCIRATDALTVERGADKVDIYWRPIVRGNKCYRSPILVGPAGSTFAADDFKLTVAAGSYLYNRNLHFETEDDPVTGERTLYVVASGFIYQTSNYSKEGDRDGQNGAPSSITNAAAWWGGLVPHATNSAAIYRTAVYLRTLYAPGQPYAFPCAGFFVNGGFLVIQTRTFEVPELWCDRGTITSGQGHYGYTGVDVIAPKIHFFQAGNTVTLRAYQNDLFALRGEIDGPATIWLYGWGGTGSPKVNFLLDGPNTNYTGAIKVETGEVRPDYHNFNNFFPTLYVADGRNLGGRMAAFNPRALTLTTLARLSVTNNASVTLEDGLNRGIYIKDTGRFHVDATSSLDVKWPLLLTGKMWKEGPGPLVLGGAMKHEATIGGALTDVPRAGSNLFEVAAGTVKIAHADALAGVETTIDAGATLQLALDPANADLTAYGIRNTTVDTPFTLDASFGGKLPLTLDTAGAPLPEVRLFTNALVTVNTTAATTVRDMIENPKPWRGTGYVSRVIEVTDATAGTVTFALESRFKGTSLLIR